MKSSEDIEDQVRLRLGEELEARLRKACLRLPASCVHNQRHTLDARKLAEGDRNETYNIIDTPNGQTIGLCMLGAEDPEEWPGVICEDPIDAQRCPYFTPLQSKDAVIEEFKAQVSDVEWLKQELPDVASLVWVLERPVPLSWWSRLKSWFFKIRIEPVTTVSIARIDVTKLLPPGLQ